MERLSKVTLLAGMAVLLLSIVLIASQTADDTIITIAVSVGCALLFFALFRWNLMRKGEVYKDERTQRIHNSAMAFSWWIAYLTLAVVTILSFADVIDIPLGSFTTVMFFIMISSYWLFKRYLSVKGEVA